jgi:tetratricopeptide (TPR) repeat protein
VALATLIFLGIRSSVLSTYNANQSVPVEFIDNALSNAPSYASLIATKVVVLGKYLELMFIPYPLLSNYSFNAIPFADFASPWFWLSFLAYGALLYFGVTRFLKNRQDPWAFAIAFYLFTLFLFSNIPFLMGAELAERFAFFASAGVCIAAALAMEQWILKADSSNTAVLKSAKALAVLAPLLLVFGGLTIARNMDWQNNYTLYKADVEKSPNDTRLHHFVATAITEEVYPNEKDSMKRHELDQESIEELRKSLAIYPDYSEAHVELGRVFDRAHQWDSAEVHDRMALKLSPGNSTANNNLGNVYLSTGRYPQAIELFKKSIALKPDFSFAYYNVALGYQQIRQYDSAVRYYNLMLGFDPNYINAHLQLGTVFMAMQKFDSAEYHFKKIMALTPGDPNAVHNLGAVYLNGKKYAQAIEQFKKTIDMSPNYLNAWSNLGRAYYYSGQYDAAIQTFNKEISIDPVNGSRDVPGIALSYQKLGNMPMALKYEAIAKQRDPGFKLQ